MKRKVIIFILIFTCFIGQAQINSKAEDLEKKITESKNDTNKVRDLVKLSSTVSNNDFKRAMSSANEALELSIKLNYAIGIADAYNGIADAFWYHSDFDKAQTNYYRSYRIHDSIGNVRGVALSLYNIGWILAVHQKNYNQIDYLYRSLASFTKIKDTAGLVQVYNGLGTCYHNQYRDKPGKPLFDSSLKYFDKGIKVGKTQKFSNKVARIYGNMSDLFAESGDLNSGLFYIDKARQIMLQNNDTGMYITSSAIRANFLLELKQYKEAKAIFEEAAQYSSRHNIKDLMASAVHGLAQSSYYAGDYKKAYEYMEQFTNLSGELFKEAYSTNIEELQGQYNLDKAEASLKQSQQNTEIEKLKNKQNSYFIFVLIGVALVVIVVAVLLFRQNKLRKTANIKLQEQNTVISEKKKEIDNSINYAKGIQNAVMSETDMLKKHFPESFIFYRPKDVVSGDFYWFHEFEDYFYCIAADCTGHGVPGALMSIVSMDKLNQAIFEKKLTATSDILSFLNVQIKKALKQHNDQSKQKDGLDIALLRFNKKTNSVCYSGANRPLYLVRNGSISEYKADKTAIAGFTPDEFRFTEQEIALQKNDSLYVFTDGYADQFGGEESKKFMIRNFKTLLQSISSMNITGQEQEIVQCHQKWKGDHEQVDDILVIGIRI